MGWKPIRKTGQKSDSLELDSLDFLNFVEELAQRSGRRIDEDDYPQLATLASGVKFLAGS